MPAPGPVTREQLSRFGREWKQGMHVLVTGPTGSGKTALARHVLEQHIMRGGFSCVLVGKLGEDKTITNDYSARDGWIRWTRWPKRGPKVFENKILLWPNTDRVKSVRAKRALQREVFEDAFDRLANIGHWTIQIDEGLYTTSPEFMNLGNHVAMLHQMGRSSNLSLLTLAQRPSHLPLVVYSSASHAFTGRANQLVDRKRLAELGTTIDTKDLMDRIGRLGRHEFLWTPVVSGADPEIVDLIR